MMKVYIVMLDNMLDCLHHDIVKIFDNEEKAKDFASANGLDIEDIEEWEVE